MQQYFSFINYETNKLTTYIHYLQLIKYLEIKCQYTVAKSWFIAAKENLEKMVFLKYSPGKSWKNFKIQRKVRG